MEQVTYHSEVLEWLSLEQPFALDVVLEDFLAVIHGAYGDGTLFRNVMWHPEQHPRYSVKDGIIYSNSPLNEHPPVTEQ